MKCKVARTGVATVFAVAVIMSVAAPAAHAERCSTQRAAGQWGFTLTGTAILPGAGAVPVAAVGEFEADEQGNFSGTEARSVGGGYADETVTGTWTVNPGCTGTLNANIYESGKLARISVTTMVFDKNSKEVRMVQKSLTLPDGTPVPVIITLEGAKQ
jgi:hypothetical protein